MEGDAAGVFENHGLVQRIGSADEGVKVELCFTQIYLRRACDAVRESGSVFSGGRRRRRDVLARRYFEGCRAVAIAVGQHRGIANKGFALPEKASGIREKLDGVRGVRFRAAERAAGRGENRPRNGRTNTVTISENRIAANSIAVAAFKKNSGAEIKRISVAKGNNVAGAVLCPADRVV